MAALGGPAPYWQSFTYDIAGNRLTSEDRRHRTPSRGATPIRRQERTSRTRCGRCRPPGRARAPRRTPTTRPATPSPGPDQTLTWDPEGRVASVAEAGQSTSLRLRRRRQPAPSPGPHRTTLYLPAGQELAVEQRRRQGRPPATTPTPGETVAVRTGTGRDLARQRPPGHFAVDVTSASQAATGGGRSRSASRAAPGRSGPARGASSAARSTRSAPHLGAREYDPQLGRFLSVDPVMDVDEPQQMHGYSYADGSPVTMSDPDGLYRGRATVAPPAPVAAPPMCSTTPSSNGRTAEEVRPGRQPRRRRLLVQQSSAPARQARRLQEIAAGHRQRRRGGSRPWRYVLTVRSQPQGRRADAGPAGAGRTGARPAQGAPEAAGAAQVPP